MALYRGYTDRTDAGGPALVLVHALSRPPRRLRHLIVHSPTGFSWGFAGSGPADLALAILADHLDEANTIPAHDRYTPAIARRIERTVAWVLHQEFTRDIIARFPQGHGFTLTDAVIDAWLAPRRAEAVRQTRRQALVALIGQRVVLTGGALADVLDADDAADTLVVARDDTASWQTVRRDTVARVLGPSPETEDSP